MKILIIEDNRGIAKAIHQHLKSHYTIDIAYTGKRGLAYAQATAYDTILLDLNLPDINGADICRALRNNHIETSIIVISGKDQITDKVSLLDMGADDYITKPFNLEELRARINVAVRHTTHTKPGKLIMANGLELDPAARTIHRNGQLISLRRKEFDLLEYMMRHPNQTLTRRMILEHIWDMNENLWANVVDVHIKYLRDKIDRPFGTTMIKTVHGLGYKLELAKGKSKGT